MGFSPNGGNISGANDVALSNPVHNDVLTYEIATQMWKNAATAALGLTKRTVTASYTLVLADATNIVLHSTAASSITVTLPSDSAVVIPQEQTIPWRQYGAGQITFVAGTGATLVSRGSAYKSAGQYAGGAVTKVAANTWLLEGDVAI